MKSSLFLFFVLVTSFNLAHAQLGDPKKLEPMINLVPHVIQNPTLHCGTAAPQLDIIIGDGRCFQLPAIADACTCLRNETLDFQAMVKMNNDRRFIEERHKTLQNTTASRAHLINKVNAVSEMTGAVYSGDADYFKESLDNASKSPVEKSLMTRGKELFVSKDKKIKETSNEFLDYIKQYESCIPFSEFSMTNSLPKKGFITALNDPELSINDFTDGTTGVDEVTKTRRMAIKDFMLFNPAWKIVFSSGDKEVAFDRIKKMYKDINSDKLFASEDRTERKMILAKLEDDKLDFFKGQKLGKNYKKSKKEREEEFEKSVELITKNADEIEGNYALLDKIVKFRGYPSVEECRNPAMDHFKCKNTYINYCNAKANQASPEDLQKFERAFEVVDDANYIMDRYRDVTTRYCHKMLRVKPSVKVSGTTPAAMTYPQFKKAYCEEKTITLKGHVRDFVCNKNQILMGIFANSIVDEGLISKDADADFQTEFLQLYTRVEFNEDSSVQDLVHNVVDSKGNSDTLKDKAERLVENIQNQTSLVFSNLDDIKVVKEQKSGAARDVLAQNPSLKSSSSDASSGVTTKEVIDQTAKVVEQIKESQIFGAQINPSLSNQYSIPAFIPNNAPVTEMVEAKTEVDYKVKNLEERITNLSEEKEKRVDSERKKEIAALEKELGDLKEYSKSIEKLLTDKKETKKIVDNSNESEVISRSIASDTSDDDSFTHVSAGVSSAPLPSKVYNDHFTDATFHGQQSIGQSAMINKQISNSPGNNEALMSVYSNNTVRSLLEKGESLNSGNFILMSSPIEITESNEGKFSKKEYQIEQAFFEEIKSNPDKLKTFFEEKKIEHVGLLTFKTVSNQEANYMVRKDNAGKILVIPVNIARKSKLDDLKRTLQLNAFRN